MKVAFFALLLLMVSAGCGTGGLREFPVLGSVTAVKIRFGSHPLLQITDARTVFQIVAFVDSHGTGWEKRWYGIQVPVATAEFYSGSDFKGSFGIGENFFESQKRRLLLEERRPLGGSQIS